MEDAEEELGDDVLASLLVYVDESGFYDRDISPIRGYSKVGKRLYGEVSGSKRGKTNLLAAWCAGEFLPCLLAIKGSVNKEVFIYWLFEMLLPTLKKGQIIILDNASFHHLSEDDIKLIVSKGFYVLFLPKYSPDLNPIEKCFATIKHYVRKISKKLKSAKMTDYLKHVFKTNLSVQT